MQQATCYPFILCGGGGTRLWPVSRASNPKQFHALLGEKSLFVETLQRLQLGKGYANPAIITNEDYRFIVAEQARQEGLNLASIILEPHGRNTAPAATIAALSVLAKDPQGTVLLVPSDHIVQDQEAFAMAVDDACQIAQLGKLVTFGIVANEPKTGYGYIQSGAPLDGDYAGYAIKSFTEKPDESTAKRYLEEGGYYWNSGMFVFKAADFIDEITNYEPEMLQYCKQAFEAASFDMDFMRLEANSFASIKGNSIDYAVMERTTNAACVTLDAGWSDVGSWSELWQVSPKDAAHNVTLGEVHATDTTGCYLRSDGLTLTTIGVKDLVVVALEDAVTVLPKSRDQEMSAMVKMLGEQDIASSKSHTQVLRPWGSYRTFKAGENYLVKEIVVLPGQKLSLQKHLHRSEHWVVVKGRATIQRGDAIEILNPNESTYIAKDMVHRIANYEQEPLVIIEIQAGDLLSEEDIIRLEDVYGRDAKRAS